MGILSVSGVLKAGAFLLLDESPQAEGGDFAAHPIPPPRGAGLAGPHYLFAPFKLELLHYS